MSGFANPSMGPHIPRPGGNIGHVFLSTHSTTLAVTFNGLRMDLLNTNSSRRFKLLLRFLILLLCFVITD